MPAQGARCRLPAHFKQKLERTPARGRVAGVVGRLGLNTICHSAKCPNCNHCFSQGTATFLILGNTCTRSCQFCAVAKGRPDPVDGHETQALAQAVAELGLKYVVITSVTRDDLADGGAGHFATVVYEVRRRNPGVAVEVLTPDFQGRQEALDNVIRSRPDVFNHNLETVARLYPAVRSQADYRRSLGVLAAAKRAGLTTKSGFMVGLGEEAGEIRQLMADLAGAGCDLVTVGQYLAPSPEHVPVARFWTPQEFGELEHYGRRQLGIPSVVAGPLVRSSYAAHQSYLSIPQPPKEETTHAAHHHHPALP